MYILDLFLVYLIKYYFEKRKGTELSKIKRKAVNFTLWCVPLKFILLFLILANHIPTIYSEYGKLSYNNLTEKEWTVHSQAIWGMTLFYPVWAPAYYVLTKVRSKDKDFVVGHLMLEPKEKCLDSSFKNIKACERYLHLISHEVNFQEEFLKNVDIYWGKNPERVCNTNEPFTRGFREVIREKANVKFPDKADSRRKGRWRSNKGVQTYLKYFKSHLTYSALNGCGSSAYENFDQIYFEESLNGWAWRGGEKTSKYFKFTCDKYEEACYFIWMRNYIHLYNKYDSTAEDLREYVCSRHRHEFCKYPRGLSGKEKFKIIRAYQDKHKDK